MLRRESRIGLSGPEQTFSKTSSLWDRSHLQHCLAPVVGYSKGFLPHFEFLPPTRTPASLYTTLFEIATDLFTPLSSSLADSVNASHPRHPEISIFKA